MKKNLLVAAILSAGFPVAAVAAEMVHDAAAQDLSPPMAVEMYLDGFHNYKGQEHLGKDKQLQERYAHYCKQVSPDMFQCLIYSGNGKDAHLVGTEHVISAKLYNELPANEKKYWHPHDGEVESGMLRAPGMDPAKEKATLEFLKTTWGKTWNVWQPGEKLPYGEPKLMWAVDKNQINDKTKAEIAKRDQNPAFDPR